MESKKHHWWRAAAIIQLIMLAASPAWAGPQDGTNTMPGARATTDQQSATRGAGGRAQSAAAKHVTDAVGVVQRMTSEPRMNNLLAQTKGIFIVPTYGRAALGVGASGGAGVLLVKRSDGSWSDPTFFNIGALSIGVQAGAEGGPIAMLLMNDKAVDSFKKKNKFSLSADAGLTVVNWAKLAHGSAGTGDVVAWAGTKGLFGNVATLGLNDIRFNQRVTQAYYGQPMTVQDTIDGKVSNPQAESLKQALAGASRTATTK
jgi:lipid-binding SYLF domain-containing protein